jgi:iduronate 2-sulfatase
MRRKLLLAACCALVLLACPASARQTNVLFIAVDDLRVELGCYRDRHVLSPHIDRLASQGTLFTRAYCQQTVCNPSRASVLTGLRPDTLRVWDLPTHFRQNKPDIVTLPQLFKQNGYHAQGIGKIFHNWRQDDYRGDARSWSVPAVLHYNSHYNDKPLVAGELSPDWSTLTKTECRDVPDDAYFDGRVADEAIRALRGLGEQPFFLAVGFWKPHLPFNAPKKYWDLYDRAATPIPTNLRPPVDVPEIALTEYAIDGKKKHLDTDDLRELHHGHLAAISYLDAQIGRVLDALETQGLRRNTAIVFWSDHGLHLGEHGLWSKTTVFDLDARVPLIIATPEHEGGQRTDALVELLDLYPTLADLCGLQTPHTLEGVSLRPLLDDPRATVKPVALTQAPRPNYPRGKRPQVMGYSIRSNHFRYTEWRDFLTDRVQACELYDHRRDPAESVNVASDRRYADDVERLAEQLRETIDTLRRR